MTVAYVTSDDLSSHLFDWWKSCLLGTSQQNLTQPGCYNLGLFCSSWRPHGACHQLQHRLWKLVQITDTAREHRPAAAPVANKVCRSKNSNVKDRTGHGHVGYFDHDLDPAVSIFWRRIFTTKIKFLWSKLSSVTARAGRNYVYRETDTRTDATVRFTTPHARLAITLCIAINEGLHVTVHSCCGNERGQIDFVLSRVDCMRSLILCSLPSADEALKNWNSVLVHYTSALRWSPSSGWSLEIRPLGWLNLL